jgi:hypothetical protein
MTVHTAEVKVVVAVEGRRPRYDPTLKMKG